MTAMGEDKKIKKGWDTMVWGGVGLGTIFASYAMVNFMLTTLLENPPAASVVSSSASTPSAPSKSTPASSPAGAPTPAGAPSQKTEIALLENPVQDACTAAGGKCRLVVGTVEKCKAISGISCPDGKMCCKIQTGGKEDILKKFPKLKNVLEEIPPTFDPLKRNEYHAAKFAPLSKTALDVLSRVARCATAVDQEGQDHMDSDLTTFIHECAHGLNGQIGGLYIGNGYAFVLEEPTIKRQDMINEVPPSFQILENFLYTQRLKDDSFKGNGPFDFLDELTSNLIGAKTLIDLQEKGKRQDGLYDDIVYQIDYMFLSLSIAKTFDRHDPVYIQKNPEFIEAFRYLIEDSIKTFEKKKGVPDPSGVLSDNRRRINDMFLALRKNKDTTQIRDLLKKWYNTAEHPDWTKKWLGF